MPDLRPPLGPALRAFGVTATVTPAGDSPMTTMAIRLRGADPPAVGSVRGSADSIVGLRTVISVPRQNIDDDLSPPIAGIPALPIGSTIAADFGEGMVTYRVDRMDQYFPDEWRVVVSK